MQAIPKTNARMNWPARAWPVQTLKSCLMTLIQGLDYTSVFIFGLTGALAASRAQLDIVGFLFLACLTAVGRARCAMCF